MKLIIDIGNTRTKAAIFNGSEMKFHSEFKSTDGLDIEKLNKKYKITRCFISSVADADEIGDIVRNVIPFAPVQLFSSANKLPFKNKYGTPDTLGTDRLAAIAGANNLYPNKNVLVIDAGTCIKYNFIKKKNEFIGGSISPGLQMRFTSLHQHTNRLPDVSQDENFDKLIGTTTNENILSGVQSGIVAEVDGIIDQYKRLYNNLTVVITGGDFNFFAKRLKNSIFAHQFLILEGLNVILDTVIDEQK